MLEIGKKYRTIKKPSVTPKIIDGLPNFYYETHVDNYVNFTPRRGINNFHAITGADGIKRIPLYIVECNPNKNTKNYNPWHDEIHTDVGIIKYFGDSKPHLSSEPNNRFLIDQLQFNQSADEITRLHKSVPVLCFESIESGKQIFHGYGIIEDAKLVTQYSEEFDEYFTNCLFTICVFSLTEDNEKFDWDWIRDRCNPKLTIEETNAHAPASWKKWIKNGFQKLHQIRRNVYSNRVVSTESQRADPDSELYDALQKIYNYYDGKKTDFEYLALEVTRKVIEENGSKCTPGWVTPPTGDGGFDFVARIDIGPDSWTGIHIVVLGQAKCESPSGSVSGKDIGRLVARLKTGWVAAFVTTQVFTTSMQKEILEDNYPILLITGKKVAEVVLKELRNSQYEKIDDYLASVTNSYRISSDRPEEILN